MHIKNLLQLLWIFPCMLLMMACSKDNDPVMILTPIQGIFRNHRQKALWLTIRC